MQTNILATGYNADLKKKVKINLYIYFGLMKIHVFIKVNELKKPLSSSVLKI